MKTLHVLDTVHLLGTIFDCVNFLVKRLRVSFYILVQHPFLYKLLALTIVARLLYLNEHQRIGSTLTLTFIIISLVLRGIIQIYFIVNLCFKRPLCDRR